MMPGTRSVYCLYLTGSSIRQRASQYAGIFFSSLVQKTPPPSRGRLGGGWVHDMHDTLHPIPTLTLALKVREHFYFPPNSCSILRHLSTPTMFVYSSNGVPVPPSFNSPLLRSASAICMVLVMRSSSVMP